MSTPRFVVGSDVLEADSFELRGKEYRHMRARRLQRGEQIVLTDGRGSERHATIVDLTRNGARIQLQPLASKVNRSGGSESPVEIHLAQAALKSDKLDLVIEKTTELGIRQLTIFSSTRCVSRPSPARVDRWQRIAQSAAKQSQRRVIPVVHEPVAFADVLQIAGEVRLLFWEHAREAKLGTTKVAAPTQRILIVIGPEGGFEASEVAAAQASGFQVIGLGPRTLRAETAALVAVALCQHIYGDL